MPPDHLNQFDIDDSKTPALKEWVNKELRPTLEKRYPINSPEA